MGCWGGGGPKWDADSWKDLHQLAATCHIYAVFMPGKKTASALSLGFLWGMRGTGGYNRVSKEPAGGTGGLLAGAWQDHRWSDR